MVAADQVYSGFLSLASRSGVPSATSAGVPPGGYRCRLEGLSSVEQRKRSALKPTEPLLKGAGVKVIDLHGSLPKSASVRSPSFSRGEMVSLSSSSAKKGPNPCPGCGHPRNWHPGCQWDGLLGLDGMQAHKVSQDVPFNGLYKSLTAAFQSLEKISPAKSPSAFCRLWTGLQ